MVHMTTNPHSERHACSDRHVVECDLIPIRRNHLERNAGETPPAWMRVRRAHARGTRLRRWRKVRSTRRRSHEDDSNRCGCRLARGRRRLIARRQRQAGNRHDRPKRYPHNRLRYASDSHIEPCCDAVVLSQQARPYLHARIDHAQESRRPPVHCHEQHVLTSLLQPLRPVPESC